MAASGNNVDDILVVGGGLAGWRAAEAAVAAGCSVTLVANGVGNSPHIHALNCPVLEGDSAARMRDDTLSSGHGTNDASLVQILCEGAVALKDEFAFDRNDDGSYKTIQPLGSSIPRCVSIDHAIGAFALAKCKRTIGDRIHLVDGRVTSLARQDPSFSATLESEEVLQARAVVIATGGWCGKYKFSTNPSYLQGDGIALAQSLGAAVRDMDAVQYEPTVRLEGPRRGVPVITTLLYEGAKIRNEAGEEFLPNAHLNKDALSKTIFAEMARTNAPGVWYDLSEVSEASLVRCNMSVGERRIHIAPAPHTSLGGVVVDTFCRVIHVSGSPIPGLFAAGEVTGGLHGRNRLGGNAGTEVLVFGRLAGERAAAYVKDCQYGATSV